MAGLRFGMFAVTETPSNRSADNSPLCQIVADRAIRLVVAARGVSGCYKNRLLAGKPTAFAATPAGLPGMMNAKDFVQFAPKQRRCA